MLPQRTSGEEPLRTSTTTRMPSLSLSSLTSEMPAHHHTLK